MLERIFVSSINDRRSRRRAANTQGAIEELEDRALLATFTVDSIADDGSGGTTLREAVAAANDDTTWDVIDFAASLAGETIVLTSHITITEDVTINGLGADQLTISGNNASRHFNITGSSTDVAITDLHLTFGSTTTVLGPGGSILALGNNSLAIERSLFDHNSTLSSAGAIQTTGLLSIQGSTFANNFATAIAGAVRADGPVFISNSTFSGNRSNSEGGALVSQGIGTKTVINSTFTGNHADNDNNSSGTEVQSGRRPGAAM